MSKIRNILVLCAILSMGLFPCCVAENALPAASAVGPNKIELKAPIAVESTAPVDNAVGVEANNDAVESMTDKQMTDEQKAITESKQPIVKDVNYDVNANDELTKNIVPNTGSELGKLVTMFAQVMLAVVVCTIIIYFLLLFVRKFFHPSNIVKSDEAYDIRDLNSPGNNDEAIKSFLDKTRE